MKHYFPQRFFYFLLENTFSQLKLSFGKHIPNFYFKLLGLPAKKLAVYQDIIVFQNPILVHETHTYFSI